MSQEELVNLLLMQVSLFDLVAISVKDKYSALISGNVDGLVQRTPDGIVKCLLFLCSNLQAHFWRLIVFLAHDLLEVKHSDFGHLHVVGEDKQLFVSI